MENESLRNYLHEKGFSLEKRSFKLFTFSRLTGSEVRFDKRNGCLIFKPPMELVISSPLSFILQDLSTGFLKRGSIRLGSTTLEVKEVLIKFPTVESSPVKIRMLSPLVVYSTTKSEDDRSFTYYYSPYEPLFEEHVKSNLTKKYRIIHGQEPEIDGFSLRISKVEDKDYKITRYKDTIIKGWMGEYVLYGDIKLIQVGIDAGLGSKNSQGYGCCTPIL
jgi:CRISPR-associated endoribonuclease Cas6